MDNTVIVFTSDNGGFDYNHAGPHMPDEFKQVPVTDNHPDTAANLDRRLAEFLADTEAAIPLANPAYRPAGSR